jgi:hypothetical protein
VEIGQSFSGQRVPNVITVMTERGRCGSAAFLWKKST